MLRDFATLMRLIGFPRRPNAFFVVPAVLFVFQLAIALAFSDPFGRRGTASWLVGLSLIAYLIGASLVITIQGLDGPGFGATLPGWRAGFTRGLAALALLAGVVTAIPLAVAVSASFAFLASSVAVCALVGSTSVGDRRIEPWLRLAGWFWLAASFIDRVRVQAWVDSHPLMIGVVFLAIASALLLRARFPRYGRPRYERIDEWMRIGSWWHRLVTPDRGPAPPIPIDGATRRQLLAAMLHERGTNPRWRMLVMLAVDGLLIAALYRWSDEFVSANVIALRATLGILYPLPQMLSRPLARPRRAELFFLGTGINALWSLMALGVLLPGLRLADPFGLWIGRSNTAMASVVVALAYIMVGVPVAQRVRLRLPCPPPLVRASRGAMVIIVTAMVAPLSLPFPLMIRRWLGLSIPVGWATAAICIAGAIAWPLLWRSLRHQHASRDLVTG
jgi:hypothetical protein